MGRITVRVVPRASRDEVVGMDGAGRLRVRIAAPPVDGAANQSLIRLVAKALKVPRNRVEVIQGETSRNKTLEVTGIDDTTLKTALTERME